MFDRFETHVHRGPDRVDVHEHRAPTDESIRLLREMEQKVEEKFLGAIAIESNTLMGRVALMRDNAGDGMRAVAVFDLNGKTHTVEAKCSGISLNHDPGKLSAELHASLTRYLAAEIIGQSNINGTYR